MKKRCLMMVLLLALAAVLPLTGALAALKGVRIENLKPETDYETNHIYLDISTNMTTPGTTVTVTVNLEENYGMEGNSLRVTYYDENSELQTIWPDLVSGYTYSFQMPEYDVSINAGAQYHDIRVKRNGQPAIDGTDYRWNGNSLTIMASGLTVTGTTSKSDKIWVATPDGNVTLTLEDLHIVSPFISSAIETDYYTDVLTLILKGKNELSGEYANDMVKAGYGALTITGDGTLDITAMSTAIYSRYDTKVTGGTLNITCGEYGVYSDRGSVEISGNADLDIKYGRLYRLSGITPTAIYSKAGDVTVSTFGKVRMGGQSRNENFTKGIYAAGKVDISRAAVEGSVEEDTVNGVKGVYIHNSAKINVESEQGTALSSDGWVEIDTDCSVKASAKYYHAVGKKLRIHHVESKQLGTILFRSLTNYPYSLLDLDGSGSLDLPVDCAIFGTTEQTDDPTRITLETYIKDNKLYVNDPDRGEALARSAMLKSVETGKLPNTGDPTNLPLLLALMALAACCLAGCAKVRRKA